MSTGGGTSPVDLTAVRTVPLRARESKVQADRLARSPAAGQTFAAFLDGLPRILAGADLRAVVDAIATAHRSGRPTLVGMGAHVVKCGLGPTLIELMRCGVVTSVAMNGSAAIHDFELALVGETSEDVAAGLQDGSFGMVRETAELMNGSLGALDTDPTLGMGACLGKRLHELDPPFGSKSILRQAHALGVPLTVHVAIGTDIIHMHPSADGAAIGKASYNDFLLFCGLVCHLTGGVYMNIGSAVIMPEVFLKAFTIAQNLGKDLRDYVTVNLDMMNHYRPSENVLRRPAMVAGKSYQLSGRHEIMIPLLAQAVVESLADVD